MAKDQCDQIDWLDFLLNKKVGKSFKPMKICPRGYAK